MKIKMNHLNLKKSITYYVDNERGLPSEIQNLPSNKLNFIKEITMRGDNVILKKNESNDN